MKNGQSSTFLSVYITIFLFLTLGIVTLVGLPKIKNNVENSAYSEVRTAFEGRSKVETDIALYDKSGTIKTLKAETYDSERSELHNALKALFEIRSNVHPYTNTIPSSWHFEGVTVNEDNAIIRVNKKVFDDKEKSFFKNAIMQIKSTVNIYYPEVKNFYLIENNEILVV